MFLHGVGWRSPVNGLTILLLLISCAEQDEAAAPLDGAAAPVDAAGACELADEMAALAGADAVDCGLVAHSADVSSAYNCALAAFAAGKSFQVAFEQKGIDSTMRRAIVRGPDGMVFVMYYDSCPMGCGDGHHNIDRAVCVQPFVLSSRSADVLACQRVVNLTHVCGQFPGGVGYQSNADGALPHVALTVPVGQQRYPAPAPVAADAPDAHPGD